MKATGIVRPVDMLGRIVLPIELRRKMGIETKDSLEIFVENDSIILRKYQPCCVFCGESRNMISYGGKKICSHCLEKLQTL